jgi:hypothetical protein
VLLLLRKVLLLDMLRLQWLHVLLQVLLRLQQVLLRVLHLELRLLLHSRLQLQLLH